MAMPARTGVAHVVTTTRKYKDRVYRTHLLRRSYREGGTVKNETLGNLSHLPEALVEIIRRSLRGEIFVPPTQTFEIARSLAHGHVHAVQLAMQRLGFASLLASKPCRERDLVQAMVLIIAAVAAAAARSDTGAPSAGHRHPGRAPRACCRRLP